MVRDKLNMKFLMYIRQNWKKFEVFVIILIFLIVLSLFLFPTKISKTLIIKSNNTIYVAGDGSGDFNCKGIDDQVEINKALAYVVENPQFTTVYLKGPNTYVISDSILIGSNTILEGDPTAVIKLEDNANWPSNKPLITQTDGNQIHGVTIKGFQIDGNHDNEDQEDGKGYYNMIYFHWGNDIQVHNMYMYNGNGDGMRVEGISNIQFYDNRIYKLGHDGLFVISSDNIEAWNNSITIRTNSGLRAWNSNHVKFHDNIIDSFYDWSAGNPGIQIEKSTGVVNDVEIYNNTIHDTYGPGIWLIGYGVNYPKEEAENVHIHNNIFYNTGTNPSIDCIGGIVTSGFYDTLIENNVFDSVYNAAVTNLYPLVTSGTDAGSDDSPKGKGYTTIIRNNIIVNTQKRKEDPNGTGYGVINYYPSTCTFVMENNCLYGNVGGKYINANSTTDIYKDPLFVNQLNHDYHLQPSSPCIGAGYTLLRNSTKPVKNSLKINIGRFV
jgi:Disaggregatase related